MEMTRFPRGLPPAGETPEEWNYYPLRAADDTNVPLTHYLWVLRRNRWRILGFVALVVTAVLLMSLQMTPIYESLATLEIDNSAQMFEIGDRGLRFDTRDFDMVVETQIQVMQSPEAAAQVIRELRLDRHPDFNPALRTKKGAAQAATKPAVRDPLGLGMPAYLPGLSVRRRPDTYLLEVRYRSPNPELAAAIANSAAKAFVEQGFRTQYQSSAELHKWLNKQLDELKAKLERSQAALRDFEKKHNLVNPEDRGNIINLQLQSLQEALAKAQAERLNKETAVESVRSGEFESLVISEQGEPLLRMAERLDALEASLAEAALQYGPNHPTFKRLKAQVERTRKSVETAKQKVLDRMTADYRQSLQRERVLTEAVSKLNAELDQMGAWVAEYNILKREVDSQTKLYEELLKKVNEASINASIKATNLRLAAMASRPDEPVSPRIKLNLLLAFLLSTTLAVGTALAVDYLDRTLRSSEQVEQWLSLPVLATLPRVQGKKIPSLLLDSGQTVSSEARPVIKSKQPFLEALTMLRTSVLLSAPASELKVILIASAAPAEGKSTVAAGMALALAQQLTDGARVLLVDSDLRRPTLHNTFGLPNRLGLSTVLEGQSTLSESIRPLSGVPNLMVLPAGPSPRYASELLTMHMAKALETIRQEYRFVVIDSAPLLVCADTTILSTMADGVLIVTRAGETPRDAVAAALRQLRRVRANVLGLVLNQVSLPDLSHYGGYYGSYYGPGKEES